MKKEFLLHKLDLLTASLAVLTSWHERKETAQEFYILHYRIRNQDDDKKQNFVFLIKYIYKIILIIHKYEINRLANKVIRDEKKSLKKYISKFLYTYYKNRKYYINSKFTSYKAKNKNKVANRDDALLQLYFISKLNKSQGIYKLIKYLR